MAKIQLYNCNNHTAINVHIDSQDDLNMTKASNFADLRRNCEIHTKPDDQILEIVPRWVSSVMDMNVLLSQNNHLRLFWDYLPYWLVLQRQLAHKS